MTYLLDVNVLIALIDPKHVANELVRAWFMDRAHQSWATCPVTENGAVRIVGAASYPNTPGTPGIVVETLRQLCALPGHSFWPDDLSLLASEEIDASRLTHSSQITDSYLRALAGSRGGKLATLDRRMALNAVKGGQAALHLIG